MEMTRMKNKKPFMVGAVAVISVMCINLSTAFALPTSLDPNEYLSKEITITSNSSTDSSTKYMEKEAGIKVSYPKTFLINGKENRLYPSFSDNKKALEIASSKYNKFLKLLANEYHLDPLTIENYKSYKTVLQPYIAASLPSDLGGDSNWDVSCEVRDILSLCENGENNNECLNIAIKMNTQLKQGKHPKISTLVQYMPYNSPVVQQYPHNHTNGGLL